MTDKDIAETANLVSIQNEEEIIKILTIKENNNEAYPYFYILNKMCIYGKTKVVDFLLKKEKVNIFKKENDFIINACMHEHYDIVKLLLSNENFDPTLLNNYAIQLCYRNRCYKLVDLLWSCKKVRKTLQNDNQFIFKELQNKYVLNNIEHF